MTFRENDDSLVTPETTTEWFKHSCNCWKTQRFSSKLLRRVTYTFPDIWNRFKKFQHITLPPQGYRAKRSFWPEHHRKWRHFRDEVQLWAHSNVNIPVPNCTKLWQTLSSIIKSCLEEFARPPSLVVVLVSPLPGVVFSKKVTFGENQPKNKNISRNTSSGAKRHVGML